MHYCKSITAALAALVFCLQVKAQIQRPIVVYGNVKAVDFAADKYDIDTSAAAVFLFDGGAARFTESDEKYDEIYQRHARIRILKKAAFGLATIEIRLLDFGTVEQKLENLQATTYNLEGGKVVSTEIDKSSMFIDKDKYSSVTRFALSNVKEGSIIEFDYTLRSPGIYVPEWEFQGSYPKLWSEYEVTIPDFFNYSIYPQGYLNYDIDTLRKYHVDYNFYNYSPKDANTLNRVWAIKNVPAAANYPYIFTLDNHISKLDFQLSGYRAPGQNKLVPKNNWADLYTQLMNRDDFGYELNFANSWLNKETREAKANADNDLQQANNVFAYVRDHYTCLDKSSMFLSQEFKTTQKNKSGNVADINMLLVGMLKNIKIAADPVILSTQENGTTSFANPVLRKYNYVVCRVIIDGQTYLLDASEKFLGFDKLTSACYNGFAQAIGTKAISFISLMPDALKENKTTNVVVTCASVNQWNASVVQSPGYQESLQIRKSISISTQKEYFQTLSKSFSADVVLQNPVIDSLKNYESSVAIKYNMQWAKADDDVLYFNPMIDQLIKVTPFASAERIYPVEMPYCTDNTYNLTMDIPTGYAVDELPESARLNLNEGLFDYNISKDEKQVKMTVNVKMNKATYLPKNYEALRGFFAFIVKKEAEQIVFKKVK